MSVSLLGNFSDHPQGKTHLRMITHSEIVYIAFMKEMTCVDTFWRQKILDYPENVHTVKLGLVHACVFVCTLVWFCDFFLIYCTHIVVFFLAPAMESAFLMNL